MREHKRPNGNTCEGTGLKFTAATSTQHEAKANNE